MKMATQQEQHKIVSSLLQKQLNRWPKPKPRYMAEASFESYLEGLEGHKFVKVTKVKKSPNHGAKTLRAQEVRRL